MSHLSPPNHTLYACLKDEMATIPDRAEGIMGMATRGGNVLLPHTEQQRGRSDLMPVNSVFLTAALAFVC